MSNGKKITKRLIKKTFEWKTFFCLESHIHLCSRYTSAIPTTSSKHVSPGMQFLGLGIGGFSHQSCMSLHIGTNNIVGGSIRDIVRKVKFSFLFRLKLHCFDDNCD